MQATEADQSNHVDVIAQQIARVYAKAFLDASAAVAEGKQDAPAVQQDVEQFNSVVVDVLDRYPRFESTLTSALVSTEEKEQILDKVFRDRASTTVLSVLKILARHGRLDILRVVRRQIEALNDERHGRREVEVRVARELTDDLRDELAERLRARMGVEPLLRVRVDPTLIAGMIVKVGDTVYDGSIETTLAKAQLAMVAQTVELIQTQRTRLTAEA